MDPLPLISLGLIDGLNICSLGLLGLFLSLMYATQTDRKTILGYGAVYIGSVFLSYLTVGVGATLLFITLPTVPHFLARIAAAGMLAIVSGIIGFATMSWIYVTEGETNPVAAPLVGAIVFSALLYLKPRLT